MEILDEEKLKKFLSECGGCGKHHLMLGNTFNGASFCTVCVDKIEMDVTTGEYHMKSKMKFFKSQGIYVKNPKKEEVVKSVFNQKKLFIGMKIMKVLHLKKTS